MAFWKFGKENKITVEENKFKLHGWPTEVLSLE